MSEAVIVSAARSPIGRAFKGSLKDERPDDLAAAMVAAALDKIPSFDPHGGDGRGLDDLYLGCAEPSGEAGSNMARVVTILAGLDGVPAATINRFCASSLQTIRMAFHAIKAGEGDAFVAAGVEAVSRYPNWAGAGRNRRRHPQSAFRRSPAAHRGAGGLQHAVDRSAAGRPDAGHLHRHGTDRGERGHHLRDQPGGAGCLGGAEPEPGGGGHRLGILCPRNHPVHAPGRHRRGAGRLPAGRSHPGGSCRPPAGVPQRGDRDRRQRVSAERRGRRRRGDE